jgi:hypothetical protein
MGSTKCLVPYMAELIGVQSKHCSPSSNLHSWQIYPRDVWGPTDVGGREWDQPEWTGKLRRKVCPKIVLAGSQERDSTHGWRMKENKGKAESGQWVKRLDDISHTRKYCVHKERNPKFLYKTQRACVLMMQTQFELVTLLGSKLLVSCHSSSKNKAPNVCSLRDLESHTGPFMVGLM